jgi:hypothetical protein
MRGQQEASAAAAAAAPHRSSRRLPLLVDFFFFMLLGAAAFLSRGAQAFSTALTPKTAAVAVRAPLRPRWVNRSIVGDLL